MSAPLGWLDALVQGALLGGLYAQFALGLSLLFGVMRLVNVAHGDLALLCAFAGYALSERAGLGPLAALALVVPGAAALGWALQRWLLSRVLVADPLPSLVVTFGLSVVIQNGLLAAFSADTRSISAGGWEARSLALGGGLAVGWLPLAALASALALTAGCEWLLGRSALGRAVRATSDDPETAALMGIDRQRIYALCTALAVGVLGVAGMLLGMRTAIAPSDGPAQLIYAFESVIIGGMGSLWGTLCGGLLLGVAQAAGARAHPGWGILCGHLAFLAVLALRPQGLFPKTR